MSYETTIYPVDLEHVKFWIRKLSKFEYTFNRYSPYMPEYPMSRSVIGSLLPETPSTEDIMLLHPLTKITISFHPAFFELLEGYSIEPFEVNKLRNSKKYAVDDFFSHFYLTLPQIAPILAHAHCMSTIEAPNGEAAIAFNHFIQRQKDKEKTPLIVGESSGRGGI